MPAGPSVPRERLLRQWRAVSYETAFAVKWLIEQQLKGDKESFDSKKGEVKAPWLSWGPYWWANGERAATWNGLSYKPTDFTDRDRMHHSPEGQTKMGERLLKFFKSDSTTKGWFVK